MRERRLDTGLTRPQETTRSGRNRQKKTGAECEEERGGHDEIGLGEYETHHLGDETVHHEEYECVEEHGHLIGFSVHERHLGAVGGQKYTGAQRQKKCGWDGNFLSRDIGKHLIYTYIIFHKVDKVVERNTS